MLGDRLKRLRGTRTQDDVAKYLGISRARYSHYENGRSEPDTEILIKLATFFNVSTDYLLGHKTNSEEYNPITELEKIIDDLGIDSFFFKDIEAWKNLRPEDVEELKRHFEYVAHKAKERNERND